MFNESPIDPSLLEEARKKIEEFEKEQKKKIDQLWAMKTPWRKPWE